MGLTSKPSETAKNIKTPKKYSEEEEKGRFNFNKMEKAVVLKDEDLDKLKERIKEKVSRGFEVVSDIKVDSEVKRPSQFSSRRKHLSCKRDRRVERPVIYKVALRRKDYYADSK